MSVFIPTNRKVERTPISETVKETVTRNRSTLERSIRTAQKLSNEQILQKLEKEVGKEAIKCWVGMFGTDTELPDDGEFSTMYWAVHNIVKSNFTDSNNQFSWEQGLAFHAFAKEKGYYERNYTWMYPDDDEWNYHFQQMITQPREATVSVPESGMPPVLTDYTTYLPQSLPKKDFSQTKYSDDFVNKYKLDKKCIKTAADKTLAAKFELFLRETANFIQQNINHYDVSVSNKKLEQYANDIASYKAFTSADCQTEFMVKMAEVERKITEISLTNRL